MTIRDLYLTTFNIKGNTIVQEISLQTEECKTYQIAKINSEIEEKEIKSLKIDKMEGEEITRITIYI